MGTLASRDRDAVTAMSRELLTLHLDGKNVIANVFSQLRECLELENVMLYSLAEHCAGWTIGRWEVDGVSGADELLSAFRDVLATSEGQALYYDRTKPAAAQRNRLIEATAMIDRNGPGTWESSSMNRLVLGPANLGRHKQHRALLCEGASLLGWFGTIYPEALTARQQAMFSALLSPMRQRLLVERRLECASQVQTALEVTMERLGSPAFFIGVRGRIHHANTAGRALLRERRPDVSSSITDALAGRPGCIAFDLTEVRDGGETYWLAIARPDPEALIAARIEACVERYGLTPRQRDVLALLVRGLANATISSLLCIGERATELHVTALLDKLGVDSRAAVAARILLG